MEDLFHREIDYLRISVTDRCNFRCSYCMPSGEFAHLSHKDILSYEEIVRLCTLFAGLGIKKVKLTGGEPLMRKDFPLLVEKIHKIKGINQVTMTSNGAVLEDYLEELKIAGLDGVNISLDTLDRVQFKEVTGTDDLPRVLSSIQKALEVGITSVKINCVPMRGINEDELVRLAAYAKSSPVEVRFIEMMPIGKGKDFHGLKEDEIIHLLEDSYGSMQPVEKRLGNGPARYYKPEGFVGHIGLISALSHKFCKQCNRIRLTSDGILKTCLQYQGYTNLKKLLRDGVKDEELIRIIRQNVLDKPECHQFQKEGTTPSQTIQEKEVMEGRVMTSIGG